MLTIYGKGTRFCDGVSRRSFLKIGGMALGGATLLSQADFNRVEAANLPKPGGKKFSHKAVIHIFLGGGPPHQDMWDLKMDAPSDIRGEMKPIDTNVSGIQICEVFPQLAKMMDKCAIIRSVVGNSGDHDGYQCLSGWPRQTLAGQGGYPALGAVAAKVQGPVDKAIPVTVGLSGPTSHTPWSEAGGPGFLGGAYAPFRPNQVGEGKGQSAVKLQGVTLERLNDRRRLLAAMDATRRDLDANLSIQDYDASTASAFDLLTSTRLADALDISKEPQKVRERYGDGKPFKFQYDGAATWNEHVLVARRLVEAGARSVSLSYGRWDSHGDNFGLVRDHGSKLDQCVSALIQDLDERGMLNDVTVIVWGEFGRTPKINKEAGRDHWPQVSCALMAGGGMKTGQVIGATNRLGEFAEERPVHVQEILATLYHNIGIDPRTTMLTDRTGRPQYLLDHTEPIKELVG